MGDDRGQQISPGNDRCARQDKIFTGQCRQHLHTTAPPDQATNPDEHAVEVKKRKQHKKQLRKVSFQAAKNLYKDKIALAAFSNALEEVRTAFNAGPATRNGVTREFHLKKSLAG